MTIVALADPDVIIIGVLAFIVLLGSLGFSIYVYFDAKADYETVKAAGVNGDMLVTTSTFVFNERMRIIKQALLISVTVAAVFVTPPEDATILPFWYVVYSRGAFIAISVCFFLVSLRAYLTRRKLGFVVEAREVVKTGETSAPQKLREIAEPGPPGAAGPPGATGAAGAAGAAGPQGAPGKRGKRGPVIGRDDQLGSGRHQHDKPDD